MSNETHNGLETVAPEASAEDLSIEELDGLSGGLAFCIGTIACPISTVSTQAPS